MVLSIVLEAALLYFIKPGYWWSKDNLRWGFKVRGLVASFNGTLISYSWRADKKMFLFEEGTFCRGEDKLRFGYYPGAAGYLCREACRQRNQPSVKGNWPHHQKDARWLLQSRDIEEQLRFLSHDWGREGHSVFPFSSSWCSSTQMTSTVAMTEKGIVINGLTAQQGSSGSPIQVSNLEWHGYQPEWGKSKCAA